jgi:hypothetical protein
VQQAHPEALLQLPNRVAERRGRDAETWCRGTEAAIVGDSNERGQIITTDFTIMTSTNTPSTVAASTVARVMVAVSTVVAPTAAGAIVAADVEEVTAADARTTKWRRRDRAGGR